MESWTIGSLLDTATGYLRDKGSILALDVGLALC